MAAAGERSKVWTKAGKKIRAIRICVFSIILVLCVRGYQYGVFTIILINNISDRERP